MSVSQETTNLLKEKLKETFGYSQFRGEQEEIIKNTLAGKNTFVIMPTGAGKSLCYQLPAIATEGTAIVISPLIALMKNQVDQMNAFGINAQFLNSSLNKAEMTKVKNDVISGQVKLLYIAPESLTKEDNLAFLKQAKISFVAIDEAHCISEWGHDFRPEYRRIRSIVESLDNTLPIIALTATATPKVQLDIQKNLNMDDATLFKSSFNRKNLYYEIRAKRDDIDKQIIKYIKANHGKAGIIYCLSRKKVEEVAEVLNVNGIKALPYHAGLDGDIRMANQEAFLNEEVEVMVATIAFGMGIDKPDVRLVVHLDLPETLEAYYQEAGRAGRDTQKAFATVLYNQNDIASLEKNVLQNYPPIELVRRVYQCLGNYYQLAVGSGELASYDLDLVAFQHRFDLPPTDTYFALKILENQGFIALSEAIHHASKISISVDNRQLYDFQLKNPKYDSFIKLLLRMYGGELFTGYLTISEATISKAFSAPLPEIEQMLGQLERFEILQYDKQKNKPQLTFLTGRYDAKTLPLQIHEIEHRKVYDLQKAKAVRAYIEHTKRCRTQLLLEYFDEHTDKNCGICDICIRKKREETTAEHSIQVKIQTKEKIKALLANGAMSLDLLSKIMQPNHNAQFQEIIREMIEDEVLLYAPTGEISLHL